ncbi:hypothetical protein G9A89_008656 [Geosiphon pyriformis]|nr:hypothetical protein G9A89_008656 [Geosiphon pyriformis]
MIYLGRFNKLLRRIRQLETNDYYFDAQILDQFITGLKDKLIKKVHSHAPADLATAIRHAKSYEMAMEEANHQASAEEKIDQLTRKISTTTMTQPKQFWITIQQPISKLSLLWNSKTLETRLSNQHYSSPQQSYYQSPPPTYYSPRPQNQNYYLPAPQSIQQQYQQPLPIQPYQTPPTQQYQNNHNRINLNNQLVPQNSGQQRPNHYHIQPSYLTIPEESDFQQTALSENELKLPKMLISNESPFLLSNAAVNEQKAITAMYTEATVEGKPIRLILDSGLAGNRPAQTVIVTADSMKKTSVEEIDNFPFSIDGITIPVKVLANANLNWKIQELKISYQRQYTIVPATCASVFEFEEEKEMPLTETYMALGSTFNWAEETEQEIFEESREWKKVRYSTPEPRKQPPYILLKCKDCNKKLSSMEACISPEEEYETRTCYFCKACHKERFGSPKRSGKWDNTPCLICGKMLPKECNWIDVAMRGGVCDQTFRRGTPFDAAYNSVLNKLYHYIHDAEMIFDLAMALINGTTQEDVCQMKKAEYIEYTMELAGFDYEDEVETYHQIASHTYPTKEAQIQ